MASNDDVLKSVDAFLRARFVYMVEIIETLQTPDYMLNGMDINGKLIGDCDDISTLHAAVLMSLGFPVRFVAIRSTWNDPNYDHVYLEVENNGKWIPYDITIPLGSTIEYFARLVVNI